MSAPMARRMLSFCKTRYLRSRITYSSLTCSYWTAVKDLLLKQPDSEKLSVSAKVWNHLCSF